MDKKSNNVTMRVIEDESEIPALLKEHIHNAEQKSKPRLHISVEGLDLPDEKISSIKSQIQQLVLSEVVKYKQEPHNIKIEPPKAYDKSPSGISLKGIPLPDEEIKRLESKIQQLVKGMLPKGFQTQNYLVGVCGCGWPFYYQCYPPGCDISLDDIDPLPPWPPDGSPMKIAVFFPEDAVLMLIENGSRYGIPPDQMWIGLTLRTSNLWAKEIYAWGICIGTVSWIRQERAGPNPVWMQISKDQTSTIFFKKAKFLGMMGDVCHFDTSEQFWRLLGGHRITFDWVGD